MNQNSDDSTVTAGSGNVFKDLGFADADTMTAKSDLALKVIQIIRERGLSQKQAAQLTGLKQPDISNIINAKLGGISIDRLLLILNRLGYSIEIRVMQGEADGVGQTVVCSL